jgi:hypothetical protein
MILASAKFDTPVIDIKELKQCNNLQGSQHITLNDSNINITKYNTTTIHLQARNFIDHIFSATDGLL